MLNKYLEILIGVLGIIGLGLLFGFSQYYSNLSNDYNIKIISEFDEKNEIFFNYIREHTNMHYYHILAIESELIKNDTEQAWTYVEQARSKWEDLGVQAERLDETRKRIRDYNFNATHYSNISNSLFKFGIVFLFIILLLYLILFIHYKKMKLIK